MLRRLLISILILLSVKQSFSQTLSTDMNALLQKESSGTFHSARKVKWMDSKSSNVIVRYNPVNLAFSSLMFVYQKVFSPQLSASCIYNPSCSNFSKQLIKEYGLVKGLFLTADRVTRCNRVSASDISPLVVDEELHLAKDDVKKFKSSIR